MAVDPQPLLDAASVLIYASIVPVAVGTAYLFFDRILDLAGRNNSKKE